MTLNATAKSVLLGGIDVFKDFADTGGETRLRNLWRIHGGELLAEFVLKDGTVRPAAWFWWSAPKAARIDYPHVLLATAQRQRLLAAGILSGTEAETARQKIREFEESGRPMAFYDLTHEFTNNKPRTIAG